MDQELRDRFITLEAGFNNFKHDHNEEAKSRHIETDKKLDKLFIMLAKLKCGVHEEKICNNSNKIDSLRNAFIVVVVLGIGLGIVMKYIMGV